jgi:threonine dehydratase
MELTTIEEARQRVAPYVRRTPTWRSRTLSERFGTNIFLKLELFQRTGSFKPRGSFNQLLALTDAERERGVVGVSGGNFAQGMAYAASVLEVACTITMPEGAPESSIAATKGYGAEVVMAPDVQKAFDLVDELAAEGRTPVHPFDNEAMIAGNGSLGLELIEDVPDLTDVFISVGGGGFITGVTSAILAHRPAARIWAVETGGADVLHRSLEAGEPVRMQPTSLAKTLSSPYLTEHAWNVRHRFADSIVVSDAAAFGELRFLLERTKVVPELAASATLAALESRKAEFGPENVAILVLCGGNISAADLVEYSSRFTQA